MFYRLSVDQGIYCFSNSRAIKDAVKNCKPRVPNTELYKSDMLLSGKQQQSVHCYLNGSLLFYHHTETSQLI